MPEPRDDDVVLKVTFRLLLWRGVWIEYCNLAGVNSWCVNEGLANADTFFDVTYSQAKKLNLIP